MQKKTISGFLVVMILFFGVSLSLRPQSVLIPLPKIVHSVEAQKVQFTISSWDYSDEYGQGIRGFFIRDNHTGVFLGGAQPWGSIMYDNTHDGYFEMNYTENTAIELDVRVALNLTLVGLTYPDDNATGINYFRLSITFSGFENYNYTEWSQQNFTYDYLSGDLGTDLWYYSEEVIINHLIVAGAIYTATLTYEVFYL